MIPSIVCLLCLSGRKVKGPKNEKTKDFIPDLNELPTGALSLDDIAENYSAVSRYTIGNITGGTYVIFVYVPYCMHPIPVHVFNYMNMAYLYILNLNGCCYIQIHTHPIST